MKGAAPLRAIFFFQKMKGAYRADFHSKTEGVLPSSSSLCFSPPPPLSSSFLLLLLLFNLLLVLLLLFLLLLLLGVATRWAILWATSISADDVKRECRKCNSH